MNHIELINQIIKKAEGANSFHRMHIKNSYFTFTEAEIGRVVACNYNIQDTLVACASYLSQEEETDNGLRYLKICGIFQTLVIQQDAINFLRQILLPELKEIIWDKQYPAIYRIRNYRNRYFGHPTEGKEGKPDSLDAYHVGALMPTSTSLRNVKLLKMIKYQDVDNAMFNEEVNMHAIIIEQLNFLNDLFDEIGRQLHSKFTAA